MSITTSMIKDLRDATSLGIADCKKALEQTNGDFDGAIKDYTESLKLNPRTVSYTHLTLPTKRIV